MPFSGLTLALAWLRCGGRCECSDPAHGHPAGSCGKPLDWNARGNPKARGAWAAHTKDGDGPADGSDHEHGNGGGHGGGSHRLLHDSLHNCEVRCGGCGEGT